MVSVVPEFLDCMSGRLGYSDCVPPAFSFSKDVYSTEPRKGHSTVFLSFFYLVSLSTIVAKAGMIVGDIIWELSLTSWDFGNEI